ncbi:symmetrical bis(5'-nucleosyl)-tetraphosphatase [Pseudoalteromonas fenneropenaei]|uniref:bis(5'-nucleosyl)-tetraphosphatase (symmetrical) n=1 Tax=Pseudoalteromonas fenneropenaei TaxID=1737459 RepID=A0ABV7CLY2_9GAMM
MARYVVGDLQGCFTPLVELLDQVDFNPSKDHLYCVGDIVARGPDSLACLSFLAKNASSVSITLGNHDLHLLACQALHKAPNPKDKLAALFAHPDFNHYLAFLQAQPLAIYLPDSDALISHAGIYPDWSIEDALSHAKFAEQCYQGAQAAEFFATMYGDCLPSDIHSHDAHSRFRAIVNVFTRMRFLELDGRLNLSHKEGLEGAIGLQPWFQHPKLNPPPCKLIFGHWAALEGKTGRNDIIALDTGYVWGGAMTLLDLTSWERLSVNP